MLVCLEELYQDVAAPVLGGVPDLHIRHLRRELRARERQGDGLSPGRDVTWLSQRRTLGTTCPRPVHEEDIAGIFTRSIENC